MPLYLDEKCNVTNRAVSGGYVLLCINDSGTNDEYKEGEIRQSNCRFEGEIVKSIKITTKNYVLDYGKFYNITKFHTSTGRKIGGVITGNLSTWIKTGMSSGYDDLEIVAGVEKCKSVEKFKYKYCLLNKVNQKITQFHHLHVRLKDLFSNKKYIELKGAEALLAMELDRFNNVEATHATFWTYYYALNDEMKRVFINLLITHSKIDRRWLKKEGILAKQSQHATKYDLSKLFELNVLENRVDEEINWDDEKEHRINPKTVNLDYSQVYDIAVKMFADGKKEGKKPLNMSWEQYWAQRAIIMPAGSVHSRYEEDIIKIKQLPRAAKNKKGFSSTLGDLPHEFFVSRRPEIEAHVSTKYEWGKTRALYGCDYTSHVNADFGLMACEDSFPSYIPTGAGANPANVEKEMSVMRGLPFCYDFDDFNSQHSISSMKAIIEAFGTVFAEFLTDEQKQSLVWTRNSIDNMKVVNNLTEEVYISVGTLFSGWRLTSFVNTALNYVYLNASGSNELLYKTVHNGDDVYGSTPNLGAALRVVENADHLGARAQVLKMNIGTIAEFLRMDIKTKDKSMAQYLTRACATFTHSRIESEAPYALKSIVSAYYVRYNELASRGAETKIAYKCYRKQLFFARELFDAPKEVIDALITYDTHAGGVVKNGYITNKRIIEYNKQDVSEDYDLIKTLTYAGVRSYITFLKSKFEVVKDAFKMSTVTNNVMRMYNVHRKSCKIEDYSSKALRIEKRFKGAWSNLPGISTIHKLRMGIADIVMAIKYIKPELAHILSKSDDPIKWMLILL